MSFPINQRDPPGILAPVQGNARVDRPGAVSRGLGMVRRWLPRGMVAALHAAGLFTLLPAACNVALAGDSTVTREYQLKAAFLYNFTRFVEWPAQRFPDAETPILIGVLGRDPFGGELERIVSGRKVNGRSIVVRRVSAESEMSALHLLFVPAGEENRAELMALIAGHPAVVTVGESERFATLGGMITFVPEADKVRFTINLGGAEQSGLKLSAQLLKLASVVRRTP
jgi:hypothetical protein